MRWAAFVFAVAAGCQFAVQGTDVPAAGGDPGGGGAGPPSSPSGGTTTPPSGPSGSTTPPTASPDLAVAPGPDMALAQVGAPCTADAQCGTGFCGHSGGFLSVPGGYCTLDCAAKKDICPAGSTCEHLTNVGDYCLSNCPPDPCRTGYKCCDLGKSGGAKTCAPSAFCD